MFDRVSGRFGEGLPRERIPWFFALLLAAAMKGDRGACCFVLDKTQGTTALTATFLALARLQEDFPHLAESYARTALSEGLHVRVKPSDFVYEYEGIWEGNPDLFRLKVLDKSEWRSFRISDVLRLEPTTRKRPKGTLTSNFGVLDPSSLDELLDITTYGNSSMIQNIVLLYMAQARFAGISEIVALAPTHSKHFDQLSNFLPWGTIGPGGEIRAGDAYQVVGEPLIAVTRVPQDLADAVTSSLTGSKIVLVDGARGIASDLQAFDDIAECQRVVILASPDETEEIRLLRDRDCPVWYMSPAEVTIGEACAEKRHRASLVGRTVRMSNIREQSQVVSIDCQCDDLQAAATALGSVTAKIDGTEEKSEIDDLLVQMYGILLEFSECCFKVGEEAKSDLQRAQDNFDCHQRWIDPNVASDFQSAFDRLRSFSSNETVSKGKAGTLLNSIRASDRRWVIATRSARTTESLRKELRSRHIDLPVFPIQAIRPEDEYDGIILLAWPGRRRFTRLGNLSVTRDTLILTYPFERRWLLGHQTRERTNMWSNQMEAGERAEILGIKSDLLPSMKPKEPDPLPDDVPADLPLFNLERRVSGRRSARPAAVAISGDSRQARLVEFYGGCYSLLTEWSQLHVLNDIIGSSPGDGVRLKPATASDLSNDDFVLFRAGGVKEFIRLLAEDELGNAEYERIRTIAEGWKSPLRRLGSTPAAVQKRLESFGLHRTLPTIAGWMGNPNLIAPRNEEDMKIIGRAVDDAEFLKELISVGVAISKIRGAHVAAGSRLTQLILGEVRGRFSQLDDQPVLLDLGYGQAWVVQVEAIDARQRAYPADQTNRLLWADDSVF